MQTHLRGRDMITTQEWTKDEIDTVLDLALDLKRAKAVGRSHTYLLNKTTGDALFLHQHPHPGQL